MILDQKLYFGTDLDVSNAADASPVLLGDVVNLGVATSYPFGGETMYFVVTCTAQIITGGTPGHIVFSICSGPEAAITTTPIVHARSHSISTDDASALSTQRAAGTINTYGGVPANNYVGGILCVIPLPTGPYKQYLGFFRQVLVETTTAGTVDAFLTKDPTYWRAFADNASIT